MSGIEAAEDINAQPADHITLDELYADSPILLAELSVCNWGTFDGGRVYTGTIPKGGCLLVGKTGSGKSTFADALQTLLLRPQKARFNTAAAKDKEKDRSLFTYVRGQYGTGQDERGNEVPMYKRPRATLCGVRALYRTATGSQITLAALFWIGDQGTSVGDIKRCYVFARRNLELRDLMSQIKDPDDGSVRLHGLEHHYAGSKDVLVTTKFEHYEQYFKQHFHMDNQNAPALLARAMGIKEVSNLTELIRDFVLEEPDTRQKAEAAIAEFEDLQTIYAELCNARDRLEMLKELPETAARLEAISAKIRAIEPLTAQVQIWFATQRADLWLARKAHDESHLEGLRKRERDVRAQLLEARNGLQVAQDHYRAVGGQRLVELQRELETSEVTERARAAEQERARTLARNLALVVPEALTEPALAELQEQAKARGGEAAQSAETLSKAYEGSIVEERRLADEIEKLTQEIRSLESDTTSGIPKDYRDLRDLIARECGIDPVDMPFVGQLIDVKESEEAWRGAINRALGFVRLRIVVDKGHEQVVTQFVNDHYLRKKVGLQAAEKLVQITDFRAGSFLRKLKWSDKSPYRDWIKRFLLDHQLDCVDSAAECRRREYSMTVEGLIHRRSGSFDKDDSRPLDHPDNLLIGFDNTQRRRGLQRQLEERMNDWRRAGQTKIARKEAVDAGNEAVRQAQELCTMGWLQMDVGSQHAHSERLRRQIDEVKTGKPDLQKAEEDVKQCDLKVRELDDAASAIGREVGGAESNLKRTTEAYQSQRNRVTGAVDEAVAVQLAERFGCLTDDQLDGAEAVEREAKDQLAMERRRLDEDSGKAYNKLCTITNKYVVSFEGESTQLTALTTETALDARRPVIEEWLAHFRELDEEQLPQYVDRFEQSVKHKTQQSVTHLFQAIENQLNTIEERIERINKVLESTDFEPNTYLKLLATKLVSDDVIRLNTAHVRVMQAAVAGKTEEQFAAMKTLFQLLRTATESATRQNKSSQIMLDARFRLDFKAITVCRDDMQGGKVFRGTGGRSGGEKESFAGAIVAASLAYVLTPNGGQRPAYASVFLDEAFSNTSDAVARQVLLVFERMGLRVNLITPFKNIELARQFVESAIIVRRDEQDSSHLKQVHWEELSQSQIRESKDLQVHAARLSVHVDAVSPPA